MTIAAFILVYLVVLLFVFALCRAAKEGDLGLLEPGDLMDEPGKDWNRELERRARELRMCEFLNRNAVADVVPVCIMCKRQLSATYYPEGDPLPPAPNHSHGLCLACAPDYMRSVGMTEEQIKEDLCSLT